ncbi:aminodeoxychorismate synthase component I [Sinimarinibacterium flocculans]|uniref:Anthranilate synthase component 1 n=1 Tax=Sinimarinibacterium flocculans TaxID=985250 RepID=A0A318EL66_9GAMM|nr:aminodeoxychorismate synthase component I [Sinimarinibacterium flocculans]PXV71622.1 anthranilate synthase component 1 [Sinimarinibacterium flocculans]
MLRHAVVATDLDLLTLHRLAPRRYPFLLESVAGHPLSGRWDLLFAAGSEALTGTADGVSGPGAQAPSDNFFEALDRWVATVPPAAAASPLPFVGGWFVLLGYEAARWVEPTLALPPSPHALPDALAVRCPAAVLRDRSGGGLHLISEDEAGLERLRADVAAAVEAGSDPPPDPDHAAVWDEQAPQRFIDGVDRILDWLRAGDAFQINLSRPWDASIADAVDAASLYRRLRATNPAPFAGLALWNDEAVVSSSPERLLQIADGIAQTRPIAGTRRRGRTGQEDRELRDSLLANVKERAEHVMLIDLERNDLGRVCMPGTVQVSELMALESYAHVHHIVSNVRGRLRAGVGPGAALRAVFPGGTITGCPKVRAMQIIAELENEGRGPYTGSMGYLSRDGQLDCNILIRSLVWRRGALRLRAGAGIVADSQASAELEETRAKARGLLMALEPAA